MASSEVFFMYDNYDNTPNTKFEQYLRTVNVDADIYLNQNTNASCQPPAQSSSSQQVQFDLQEQQKFVQRYINKTTPFRGLLIWHGLGSGKTCASVAVANTFTNMNKVVVLPAALVGNFIGDYKKCGNRNAAFVEYQKAKMNDELKGEELESVEIGEGGWTLAENIEFLMYTSNGSANSFSEPEVSAIFENKLIIFDESQLLVDKITNRFVSLFSNRTKLQSLGPENASEDNIKKSTRVLLQKRIDEDNNNPFFKFYQSLKSLEKSRILFLSGTPIVKTPFELAILFNIIHGDIISWEITPTNGSVYYEYLELLGALTNSTTPDHIKLVNNIDSINSKLDENTGIITIYKNPYNFVNKEGFLNARESLGILYNEQMTCDNAKFEELLGDFFVNHTITKKSRPLFEENVDTFKNLSFIDIKRKIKGLSSYFGNINKLLPRIELFDMLEDKSVQEQTTFLTNNNLYKYGIGCSNDARAQTDTSSVGFWKPLYEIRYTRTSAYQDRFITWSDMNKKADAEGNVSLLYGAIQCTRVLSHLSEFIYPGLIQFADRFATNTQKYKVPKLGFKLSPEDIIAQVERIAQIGRAVKILPQELSAQRGLLKKTNTSMNLSDNPTNTLQQLPIQRETITGNQVITSYRELTKTDLYSGLISVIGQVWNVDEFNRGLNNSFIVDNDPNNVLKMSSPKIYEVVKSILDNPTKLHIIYSEFLQVNIPLVRALQANAFVEYKNKTNVSQLSDAPRYMFYTGSGTATTLDGQPEDIVFSEFLKDKNEGKSSKDRNGLLEDFNNPINKNGAKIRVIIINSAAAEGITIRNVRFVHLLHSPANMSKLFQICGRAIRNCTHQSLPEDERSVTSILYITAREEENYDKLIKINRANVPYLNVVKESTIDCFLNKSLNPLLNCDPATVSNIPEWSGYKILFPSKPDDKLVPIILPVQGSMAINSRKTKGGKRLQKTKRNNHKNKTRKQKNKTTKKQKNKTQKKHKLQKKTHKLQHK
jgi:hypothetical protein